MTQDLRMRVLIGLCLLFVFSTGMLSCSESKQPHPSSKRGDKRTSGINTSSVKLPKIDDDAAYHADERIKALSLDLETRLDFPSLAKELYRSTDLSLKEAFRASGWLQRFVISDERAKAMLLSKDVPLPEGTEIRYAPTKNLYLIYQPHDKRFWSFNGVELANFLEGGPRVRHQHYQYALKHRDESARLLERKVTKTTITLSFDWEVSLGTPSEGGTQRGKSQTEIDVWHTKDPSIKTAWAEMMIDFLTMPFQNEEGRQVLAKIKPELGFPLKWEIAMTIPSEKQQPPRLVSEAKSLSLVQVSRRELAVPPKEGTSAREPFQFAPGGQTVSEETLAKIPTVDEADKSK